MTADLNLEVSRTLDARRRPLAEAITVRQYELRPELAERWGERGRAHCLQDAEYHLSYLADALATSSPSLFSDYADWARVMLGARGIPAEDLARNLEVFCEILSRELPGPPGDLACEYVQGGLSRLAEEGTAAGPEVCETDPLFELSRRYMSALLDGKRHAASRLILKSVESGVSIRDLYLHVFQRTQHEIGRLWQTNQLSVAQEHYCTAATQLIMSQLYPYIFSSEKNGRTLLATCVAGDLHEIGVRMVADFFEMEGWDTFYLGANTPKADLIRTLDERRVDVLAVSATMTFHVRMVADLIAAVRSSLNGSVKVLVGGYPFNVEPDLWRRIGADGSARDAGEAIALAGQLVEVSRP
jgi:MerR family transcriptional regulator, light-induced transcriptional regulator